MSLTAIVQLMEYEEALYILKQENDVLKSELEKTQHRLGNVESRLHEVEATIASRPGELVKVVRGDLVLVHHEKTEKGSQ